MSRPVPPGKAGLRHRLLLITWAVCDDDVIARVFAVLGLLIAFVAIPAGTAVACSCARLDPEEQVGQADAVFLGTAVNVRARPAADGGSGLVTAELRADHVYKGRADAEFEVVTPAHSAACGYQFERGGRYLVLAKADGDRLTTSLCSGNLRVPDTGRPLRASDQVEGAGLRDELIEALGTPRAVSAASPTASPTASSPASSSVSSPVSSDVPATGSATAPERGIDITGFLLLISPAVAVAILILWLRLRDRRQR